MTGKRGRPKLGAEGALKQRIVAAAAAEFSHAGYAGARIVAIARRAGCSRGIIYFYFAGKKALFEAALDDVATHRASQIGAQPQSLAEGLVYWFRQNMAEPQRIRLIMQEALVEALAGPTPARRAAYLKQQLEAVRAFQAQGLLRNDLDPRHLLALFLAVTSFPASFPRVAAPALDADDDAALRTGWETLLKEIAVLLAP